RLEPPRGGGEQGLVAGTEREKLLGPLPARGGPQARAAAAGQDHRVAHGAILARNRPRWASPATTPAAKAEPAVLCARRQRLLSTMTTCWPPGTVRKLLDPAYGRSSRVEQPSHPQRRLVRLASQPTRHPAGQGGARRASRHRGVRARLLCNEGLR